MDRQRLGALGALLIVCGCVDTSSALRHFDGPGGLAVLNPEDSPFDHPIGLVANSRSGNIVAIDLAEGWLLADRAASPFLSAAPVAASR